MVMQQKWSGGSTNTRIILRPVNTQKMSWCSSGNQNNEDLSYINTK